MQVTGPSERLLGRYLLPYSQEEKSGTNRLRASVPAAQKVPSCNVPESPNRLSSSPPDVDRASRQLGLGGVPAGTGSAFRAGSRPR